MRVCTENAVNYINGEFNRVLESEYKNQDYNGYVRVGLDGISTNHIGVNRDTIIKIKGLLLEAALQEDRESVCEL